MSDWIRWRGVCAQGEVRQLKEQLAHQEELRPSAAGEADGEPAGAAAAAQQDRAGATLMDQLASRIHATVAERINQQKALFEAQDANVRNRLLLERLVTRLQVWPPGSFTPRLPPSQKRSLQRVCHMMY